MREELEKFQILKPLSAHRQISEQLRQEILQGKFAPGARLPNASDLAEVWGVSSFTVHNALVALVKEGLLFRRPGAGTFVAEKLRKLTCVAVYFGRNISTAPATLIYHHLHHALCKKLGDQQIAVQAFIDSRPEDSQTEPYEPLLRAIENNEVQGLICLFFNQFDIVGLKKLPIPTVFYSRLKIPNKVTYDMRQFFEVSLEQLRSQGCRSVGLISAVTPSRDGKNYAPFSSEFLTLAPRYGLETRDEWIHAPQTELAGEQMEQFGYDRFQKLWSGSSRPDGLIVWPDVLARGVAWAIGEGRVSVPEELRVVFHRNEKMKFLCPFPASWMELSISDTADALIQQIQTQFEGKQAEPISIPFRLVKASKIKKAKL